MAITATYRRREQDFLNFHGQNPQVYAELRRLALLVKSRGYSRFGMAALWERLRWLVNFELQGEGTYKLNNNHRSFYAKLLMTQEPELDGFFEVRETARTTQTYRE